MGLYRSSGVYCTQCEADGFRRITYFLDRPDVMAVYTTRLEADRAESPVLLGNGNLRGFRPRGRRPPLRDLARSAPEARLPVRPGGRPAREGRDPVHHDGGPAPSPARSMSSPARRSRADYALDAVIRSMAWDETAFGRAYDLDVFNVVAVSDFNMGAMENKGLNIFNDKYVLASPETATDGDYAAHRGDHRARVFPQLVGQPRHLPRLVPALPEGGPDGLPRPGILRRHALPAGAPDRRGPLAAGAPVPRGCRAAAPPGAAPGLCGDQQLLHGHRLRQGRRDRPDAAHADRPEAFRAGMDRYFADNDGRAATVEDFLAAFATVTGRDLDGLRPLVRAARHAAADRHPGVRSGRPPAAGCISPRRCRARRGRTRRRW